MAGCTGALTLLNRKRAKQGCTDKLALSDDKRAELDTLTLENEQKLRQGCINTVTLTDEEIAKHGCTDTPTLADEEEVKQGIHELEISFKGESGLEEKFNRCTKNPGHLKFEPSHDLILDYLPEKFRWRKYFYLIKHLADMTVKLSVTFISPKRPRKFPYSKYAGQRKLMVGSGCMTDIDEDIKCVPCPFEDCTETLEEHEVYGYITVVTAAHVVCDDLEARNTTVEFFYDFSDCKTNVKRARGVKVGAVSSEGDFCELLCVLHDKLVLESIRKHLSESKGRAIMRSHDYTCKKKTPHDTLLVALFVDWGKLEGFFYGSSLHQAIRLCGGRQTWPCPFKDCPEVSGEHEVYGYIGILITGHPKRGDQSAADKLTVEVTYDNPDYSSDKWTMKGVKFVSRSTHRGLQELLCIVHDREVFKKINYVLLGNKNVYSHYSCNCYSNVVLAVFKDKLKIDRSSSFVNNYPKLCADVNYVNQNCVDTLMTLLTYTIPKIEKAFNRHGLYSILLDEYKTEVTARNCIDSVIRSLGMYSTLELKKCTNKIRRQLENLSSQGPVMIDSLNRLLAEAEMEASRCLRGMPNKLRVTGVNGKHLSIVVYFRAPINLDVRAEHLRVPSDMINYKFDDVDNDEDDDTLLVHISHPHGQYKHITFGELTKCDTGDGFYRPLYTAPTCPGSSGGPVWVIPAPGDLSQVYGVPHSNCHDNEHSEGSSWTLYPP